MVSTEPKICCDRNHVRNPAEDDQVIQTICSLIGQIKVLKRVLLTVTS